MRVLIVVLVVAAAVSCAPRPRDLPFDTITRGYYCTGAPANAIVVQNPGDIPPDWKKEWFDNADFDNHTVFAIALGRRFTGGYAIDIRTIRADDDGGVLVFYQTSAPGAGDIVTQALTNPCHIVRVPKITGNKTTFQKITADNN